MEQGERMISMKKHLYRRSLLALVMVFLLTCTALAETSLSNFKPVREYEGNFTDVNDGAWYAQRVKEAFSYGLISGMTPTTFAPDNNLTVAECITLAARLHSIYVDDAYDFTPNGVWYRVYVDYALSNGIISAEKPDYNKKITRGEMAEIMANVFDDAGYYAVNNIEYGAIPDVLPSDSCYEATYKLYRAGVLIGMDTLGTSGAKNYLKRSEAATILIRLANKDVRVGVWFGTTVRMYNRDGSVKDVPKTEWTSYGAKGWALVPYSVMPSSIRSQGKTQTDIPVISVNTGGKEVLSKEDYVNCTVNVYNVLQSNALTDATGGIRLRGNASCFYGNKAKIRANPVPYRLKFDSKVNILGLNNGAKFKSWVLLTNLDTEKDVIKTDIAFRIGRMLMKPDNVYCSDGQLVHYYLNNKFQGTYLLCEQNQANKNRVNVSEPENGYTGTDVGYLVELDGYYEKPNFMMNYEGATVRDVAGTSRKFRSNSYTVKTDTFSQQQVDFIAKYIRGVFKIVYQACEKGNYLTFDSNYNVVQSSYTNAKDCVGAVMDLNSVVDMYILYEIMCDNDVGESSFFMCVDFSSKSQYPKLTFTAPWDFNWTCQGSASGSYHAATFRNSSFISRFGDRSNPWFIVLVKQAWFRSMVKNKWISSGGSTAIVNCLDQEYALINHYLPDLNRRTAGIMNGAKANLRWINDRTYWLNTKWG